MFRKESKALEIFDSVLCCCAVFLCAENADRGECMNFLRDSGNGEEGAGYPLIWCDYCFLKCAFCRRIRTKCNGVRIDCGAAENVLYCSGEEFERVRCVEKGIAFSAYIAVACHVVDKSFVAERIKCMLVPPWQACVRDEKGLFHGALQLAFVADTPFKRFMRCDNHVIPCA